MVIGRDVELGGGDNGGVMVIGAWVVAGVSGNDDDWIPWLIGLDRSGE